MLIPMLELKTLDGEAVPWNDWWQRRPVALFFTHDSCEACDKTLKELYEHRDEGLDPESVRLVIHSGDSENSESRSAPELGEEDGEDDGVGRHHLLHISDPDGRFAHALRAKPGMVLAADRFFEVRTSVDVHEKRPGQAVDRIFQRIGLAEGECPECGAPVW